MKNKKDIFITNSFRETQKLGEDLIDNLSLFRGSTPKALVVALYGDLGGGKTTFAQGLAKGLGIKRRIISPTFIIIRQYGIKNPFGFAQGGHELRIMNFYHIDLYRIENSDVKELGLEEILDNHNNIIAVEWAEKMGKYLPKNRIDIKFEYLDKNRRKILVNRK